MSSIHLFIGMCILSMHMYVYIHVYHRHFFVGMYVLLIDLSEHLYAHA